MNISRKAAEAPHAYLLPEEGFAKLEQIRDQLLLMGSLVIAVTLAEEDTPLELRRSMLGQCFENFGLQVDEVLKTMAWKGRDVRRLGGSH